MSPQTSWILVHEVMPRISALIPCALKKVGAEDSEEVIQDATVTAAKLLISAEAAGKKVTASHITYYALQHVKSGRRSVGYSNADALDTATQLNGRSRVSSFDLEIMLGDDSAEEFTVNDVFPADQEDPATVAARKIDWEEFCSNQNSRSLGVLQALADEVPLLHAAKDLGITYTTARRLREELGAALLEFMGKELMFQATQQPSWRAGILANREKNACHAERRLSRSSADGVATK